MGKKEQEELTSYIRERNQIVDRLTRIKGFITNFKKEKDDLDLVEARYTIALNTFEAYSTAQAEIDSRIAEEFYEEEKNKRLDFEELYYEVIAKTKKLLTSRINNENDKRVTVDNSETTSNNTKINLPFIALPEFNGEFAEWINFRDTFTSVIHENKNLANIEKLHYLRSALKGDALRAIESLTYSNSNYVPAWDLLKKRFEKKRLIVQSHIRNLINLTSLNKGNKDSLRPFIDAISANTEVLKVFEINLDDALLVTLLADKLDFQTSKEWQSSLKQEFPTFAQFKEFLESKYENLESISQSYVESDKFRYQFKQKSNIKFNKNASAAHFTTKQPSKYFCMLCKKTNHLIYQCTKFLQLNISNRIQEVLKLDLCQNCLKSGHNSENCKSTIKCRECEEKHNSLLHIAISSEMVASTSSNISNTISNVCHSETLLSTAIVKIRDHFGQFQVCRALLDGGSQSNFITTELCARLNLTTSKINHKI